MRISDWSSDVCSSDLRRIMMQPMTQTHRFKFRRGPRERIAGARDFQRHRDIFNRGHRRQQMEALQDDADASTPRPRQPIFVQWAIVDPRDAHVSPAGALQPRSEEHPSELQSLMRISYAVFCLKKQ